MQVGKRIEIIAHLDRHGRDRLALGVEQLVGELGLGLRRFLHGHGLGRLGALAVCVLNAVRDGVAARLGGVHVADVLAILVLDGHGHPVGQILAVSILRGNTCHRVEGVTHLDGLVGLLHRDGRRGSALDGEGVEWLQLVLIGVVGIELELVRGHRHVGDGLALALALMRHPARQGVGIQAPVQAVVLGTRGGIGRQVEDLARGRVHGLGGCILALGHVVALGNDRRAVLDEVGAREVVIVAHEHRVDAQLGKHRRQLAAALRHIGVVVVVGERVHGVVEHHDLPLGVRVLGDGVLHERLVLGGRQIVGVQVHEQHAVVGVPVVAGLRARQARCGALIAHVGHVVVVGVTHGAVIVVAHRGGLGQRLQRLGCVVGIVLALVAAVVDLVARGDQEVGTAELLERAVQRVGPTRLVVLDGAVAGADLRVARKEEVEALARALRPDGELSRVAPFLAVAHAVEVGGAGSEVGKRRLVGLVAGARGGRLGGGHLGGGVLGEGVALFISGGLGHVLDVALGRGGTQPVDVARGLRGAHLERDGLEVARGLTGIGSTRVEGELGEVEVDVGARGAAVMELHRHHVARGLEIQGRDIGDVDGAGLGMAGVGTAPGVLALDIAAHISGVVVLGLVAHLGDLHAVDVDEGGVVVLEGTGDGLHRVGIGHIEGGAEVVGRDVLEAAGTVLGEEHLGRVSVAQIGIFTQLGAEGTLTRLPGLLGDRGARLPAVRRLSVVVAVLPLRGAGHHDVRVLGVGLGGCGTRERAAQHHGQREEERYRARGQTAREQTATPPRMDLSLEYRKLVFHDSSFPFDVRARVLPAHSRKF